MGADLSGFDKTTPSGTSQILDGDDKIRSIQSAIQETWTVEHFFKDGSTTSGGEHKFGSARPFYGPNSEVSASGRTGDLMVNETSDSIFDVSPSGPVRLSGEVKAGSIIQQPLNDDQAFYIQAFRKPPRSVRTFDPAYLGAPVLAVTQLFLSTDTELGQIQTVSSSTTFSTHQFHTTTGSEVTEGESVGAHNVIAIGRVSNVS